MDRVNTYITGNSAICAGAAIAVNGNLIIGRDDGTVTLNIEKIWGATFDEDDLPESVTVEIYGTDSIGTTTSFGTATINAADDWKLTITDLSKYDSYYDQETQTSGTYTYTVKEISGGDYLSIVTYNEADDGDGNDDTVEYDINIVNLPTTELTLRKTVEDTTTTSKFEFIITLYYNGAPYSGTVSATDTNGEDSEITFTNGEAIVELGADEEITITLGTGMTYTIEETSSSSSYDVSYTIDRESGSGAEASGTVSADGTTVVFVNKYNPDSGSDPDPSSDNVTYTVKKVWSGDDEDERPESITVTLYRDGKEYKTVTLSEDNNWKYTWTALTSGHTWTVEEVDVPDGYTSTVSKSGKTYTVTNTYEEPEEPEDTTETEIPEDTTPDEPTPEDTTEAETPEDSTPEESSDDTTAQQLYVIPKTGDSANIMLWVVIMAMAVGGIVFVLRYGRKKK